MKKKRKIVKKRHSFFRKILAPVGKVIATLYKFKCQKFKIKKGEQYLILANHQTLLDPVLVSMSFNKHLYIVSSDHIFNKSLGSRLLQHALSPIKKKKATTDILFIRNMLEISKAGGNILMFPEGNRAWADFQFYIDPAVCKLVRMLNLPVILYNLNGGYGVEPRWSDKKRKGKFYGSIKRVISTEEISEMTNEQLCDCIINGLRVIDSEAGEKYKSKNRAEYRERAVFVCPNCKSEGELKSSGNHITCNSCGLKVEYTEDLLLKSEDKKFKFNKLIDWYDFQREYIKSYKITPLEIIFKDDDVKIIDKTTEKRKLLDVGEMILTDKFFTVGKIKIDIDDISSYSVIGGRKIIVNTQQKSYFIVGNERFNPIKYVLMMNKLSNKINDKYYA